MEREAGPSSLSLVGQGECDFILSTVEGNGSSKTRYYLLWMSLQRVSRAVLKWGQRGSEAGQKLRGFCRGPDGRWPQR